jgi:ribose-phosphate pyrophosphokinase
MNDVRSRARVEEGLVTILPADAVVLLVRVRAHFEDGALSRRLPDVDTVDDDLVTHFGMHSDCPSTCRDLLHGAQASHARPRVGGPDSMGLPSEPSLDTSANASRLTAAFVASEYQTACMDLSVVSGSAHPALCSAIASHLDIAPARCEIARFPDDELHVVVDATLRGRDVFVVQPTGPPADANLIELLLLADACRRAGADRVTAVIPYFGYARQDRRSLTGEAIGARVMASAIDAARVDGVVVVDPHTASLEAMFEASVDAVSALPVLLPELEPSAGPDAVLVAPDLGAVKLVERFAGHLDTPVAVVRKVRVSGEEVRALQVVGDVRGRRPVIIDDMISTGGTIQAAVEALIDQGCVPEIVVAATHGLFVPPIEDRWSALPIQRVVVTDTLPARSAVGLPVHVVDASGLLAEVVRRLNRGQPLEGLAG